MPDDNSLFGVSEEDTTPRGEMDVLPILPDGIGMDFDEINQKLAQLKQSGIKKDDPLMTLIPLLNIFLGEQVKLHERHNLALKKVITEQTSNYLNQIQQTSESFRETLKHSSVEAIRDIFNSHAVALNSLKIHLWWAVFLVVTSSLANLFAMSIR